MRTFFRMIHDSTSVLPTSTHELPPFARIGQISTCAAATAAAPGKQLRKAIHGRGGVGAAQQIPFYTVLQYGACSNFECSLHVILGIFLHR